MVLKEPLTLSNSVVFKTVFFLEFQHSSKEIFSNDELQENVNLSPLKALQRSSRSI